LVLGMRAGMAVSNAIEPRARSLSPLCRTHALPRPPRGVRVNLEDLTYSLKSLMWRQMGIERSAEGLRDALNKIEFWSRAVQDLGASEPRALELVNMLSVSRLATLGALAREESRGCHYRADFPESRAAWCQHTRIQARGDAERLETCILEHQPVLHTQPA
jgi:L-aspartate oxidase